MEKSRRHPSPSRPLDENEHKQYVALLLERLANLRRETDPAGGKSTATRKNNKAISAQILAGRLVHAVAGWAIDHQYGLALNKLETPVGSLSSEQIARLDSHEHEQNGAAAVSDSIDPNVGRKLLLELLVTNPGAFPGTLQQITVESLRELEYGRTLPLLCPRKRWKKRGHRELRLQLSALGFIEYRLILKNKKTKRYEVEDDVADAFGVDRDTLLSWRKRLRKELERREIASAIDMARNGAKWVRAARNAERNDADKFDEYIFERLYGNQALKDDGREYRRRILKNGAKNRKCAP